MGLLIYFLTPNYYCDKVDKAKLRRMTRNTLVAAAIGGFLMFEGAYRDARMLLRDPYKNMTAQEAVISVNGWNGAEDYLIRHMRYDLSKDFKPATKQKRAPFGELHELGKGICGDGATVAATLLSNDGSYLVYRMSLESRFKLFPNHEVAVVFDKRTGKYGVLGINAEDDLAPLQNSADSVFRILNARWFWIYNGYILSDYDNSTLMKGVTAFDRINSAERQGDEKFYTFVEYKEGTYAVFEGKIPAEAADPDVHKRTRLFESAKNITQDEYGLFVKQVEESYPNNELTFDTISLDELNNGREI